MMDALDVTSPALRMAMEPQRDVDIRKSAVVSLSFVAGRALERNEPLTTSECIASLIQLSADPLPVLRQSAAFALGLFRSPEAAHQLEVLLGNGDEKTRVNAAIGLARQGSTVGFNVIRDSLKVPQPAEKPTTDKPADELSTTEGEQFLVVKNVLKAVADLAGKFTAEQRAELVPLVQELSSKHPEIRIRVDAAAALNALQ